MGSICGVWRILGRDKGIEPSFGFAERTYAGWPNRKDAIRWWNWQPSLRWVALAATVVVVAVGGWIGHDRTLGRKRAEVYARVQHGDYLEDYDVIASLEPTPKGEPPVRRVFLLAVLMMAWCLTRYLRSKNHLATARRCDQTQSQEPMRMSNGRNSISVLTRSGASCPLRPRQSCCGLHRALAEMPPDQRKFIHDRIERFLNMSPAEREKLQQNRPAVGTDVAEQRQKAREEFRKRRQEIEEKWHREHPGEGTSSNIMHDSKSPIPTESRSQSPPQPAAP